MQLIEAAKYTLGCVKIAQVDSHMYCVSHTAPDDEDPALVFDSGIDHLLNA